MARARGVRALPDCRVDTNTHTTERGRVCVESAAPREDWNMLRSIGRVVLGIGVTIFFGPGTAWAQDWEVMPNNQINQITNTTEWHSMEQTLQRAGYVRAVNKEEGYTQFITGYPPYTEKMVVSGWRNPTTQKVAIPSYYLAHDPSNGNMVGIYCYTVGEVVNGVEETTTYSWDTPAHIGDDSRIIQILKNYAGCVMGGLTASGAGALLAGAYDGDSFIPTLLGGVGYTYGSCIYGGISAYMGW